MSIKPTPIDKTQKLSDLAGDDLPRTCKRVIVRATGGPDVLELIEGTMPEPEAGEARVRTLVAGVSQLDLMHRSGVLTTKLPYTPGYDILGVVDKLGEDVSGLEVGQIVAVLMPQLGIGGYADYACIAAPQLTQVPKGLDLAEALCLVLNYVAAHQMLHRVAKVEAGQRLLVHGAAGGVGTALVELGRLAGCEVFGTSSGGKHDTVEHYGGVPIDYRSEDVVTQIQELTGGAGVDVVFDSIGGEHFDQSMQCLTPKGHLISFGSQSAMRDGSRPFLRYLRMLKLKTLSGGRKVSEYSIASKRPSTPESCKADLALLLNLLKDGKIAPLVARRVPLNKVSHAHRMLEDAEVAGKIVLICNV